MLKAHATPKIDFTPQQSQEILIKATSNLPWLKHIPKEHLHEFFIELFNAIHNFIETNDPGIFIKTFRDWEATAEVLSSDDLMSAL